jgi:hypothetical protein
MIEKPPFSIGNFKELEKIKEEVIQFCNMYEVYPKIIREEINAGSPIKAWFSKNVNRRAINKMRESINDEDATS